MPFLPSFHFFFFSSFLPSQPFTLPYDPTPFPTIVSFFYPSFLLLLSVLQMNILSFFALYGCLCPCLFFCFSPFSITSSLPLDLSSFLPSFFLLYHCLYSFFPSFLHSIPSLSSFSISSFFHFVLSFLVYHSFLFLFAFLQIHFSSFLCWAVHPPSFLFSSFISSFRPFIFLPSIFSFLVLR